MLALEAVLIVRNVFRFCLKDFKPNDWRAGNNQEVTQSVDELVVKSTLPRNFLDQVGMILTGRLKDPANFFYHYFGITFHPFHFLEFVQ